MSAPFRTHAELIHRLAAPLRGRGKLIVAGYGEDPATKAKLKPKVEHVAVGDVGATLAAIERLREEHRNVYMPLTVLRPDLETGKRGEEADIVAVLGLVADFDDADAARWSERLPAPANYVLETSAGRFQAFYLFADPASPDEAKAVAERLMAHAGCDTGTKDVSHVWRVPGLLNWPNAKKVGEGRSAGGTISVEERVASSVPAGAPDPRPAVRCAASARSLYAA